MHSRFVTHIADRHESVPEQQGDDKKVGRNRRIKG